jgi:glyoxylase-like metal-dependent hydrolase (beta-lactamase superfamily II)
LSIKLAVGDLTIHRIIEQETTFLPALDMLSGLTAELLEENKPWMREASAIDESDVLILCFQSYIIKTPHHTILVDSCIGNDKPRPLRPKWNMKIDATYMRALAGAGFSVDDIDYVMCTHLHIDHVGWNTRRNKDHAVVSGDLMHSPLQARYPHLSAKFDVDQAQAAMTRRNFLERYCDTDTLCCTAHFPSPSTGKIRRWGDGFSCKAV